LIRNKIADTLGHRLSQTCDRLTETEERFHSEDRAYGRGRTNALGLGLKERILKDQLELSGGWRMRMRLQADFEKPSLLPPDEP
jgi:ATPase subunit of ABC transporter with duplicated ATPase domains